MSSKKIGFLSGADEEEELYVPKSYIVCKICKDEIRSDEMPQKNDEKKFCSCKNLELGCIEGDGHPCKVGTKNGFITVKYKTEYPLFIDKDVEGI